MKKKLALLFGTLIMAISLTACGTDPKEIDYNGKTYDQLNQELTQSVSVISSLYASYQQIAAQNNIAEGDYSIMTSDDAVKYYEQYGVTRKQLESIEAWGNVVKEYGELNATATADKADSFTVTKAGNTTTTDQTLVFEKDGVQKDVVFEMVYKSWNMELTGVTIEPYKSFTEKMANAGLNTLIAMSVVFVVLIVICLLITSFKIFPYLEKKKKEREKNTPVNEVAETNMSANPVVVEEQSDDLELIAVIAAAIAASEGCSTSDFVVRSINRR